MGACWLEPPVRRPGAGRRVGVPEGEHSVTAELSVDVVAPPSWPRPELVVRARLARPWWLAIV